MIIASLWCDRYLLHQIRNSWSPDWGEDGAIRIKYGVNTCGLATEGGSYTDVYNI